MIYSIFCLAPAFVSGFSFFSFDDTTRLGFEAKAWSLILKPSSCSFASGLSYLSGDSNLAILRLILCFWPRDMGCPSICLKTVGSSESLALTELCFRFFKLDPCSSCWAVSYSFLAA